MKSRTAASPERAKLRTERQAKLNVVRVLLFPSGQGDIKWELGTRKQYPGLYFSELVSDEKTAKACRDRINQRFYPNPIPGTKLPCNYEASKSVAGMFRVIVYLDELNIAYQTSLLTAYRAQLHSLCDRINALCVDIEDINFKVSQPPGRLLPAIFAEATPLDDSFDLKQHLAKIFATLAETIGLYPGDTRYHCGEKFFIDHHQAPTKIKSLLLSEMNSSAYVALLSLFQLSERLESMPLKAREKIVSTTLMWATPSLPRDVGKLLARVGLIQGKDAMNLKEALLPQKSSELNADDALKMKFVWR